MVNPTSMIRGNLNGSREKKNMFIKSRNGDVWAKLVVKSENCNDTNEDQKGECDKNNTQRRSGDARDMADMF